MAVSVVIAMRRPDGGGPGLSYKPLNTAIGRALAPIVSIGHRNAAIWLDV
jgi:hypothetical protein